MLKNKALCSLTIHSAQVGRGGGGEGARRVGEGRGLSGAKTTTNFLELM